MADSSHNPLKRLIREIHRRSLWQVLGIYLLGSWFVYEVVQGLTEGLGLPESAIARRVSRKGFLTSMGICARLSGCTPTVDNSTDPSSCSETITFYRARTDRRPRPTSG